MARARNGKAISARRASRPELRKLRQLLDEAKRGGDLRTWRRATAVLGYLNGVSVIQLAAQLDVTRGSVNRWLQWFEAAGTEGLRARERPGGEARLSDAQRQALVALGEAGPMAAGYQSVVWTGPVSGELIRERPFRAVKHKPGVGEASWGTKKQPASGSMARCIEPGRA